MTQDQMQTAEVSVEDESMQPGGQEGFDTEKAQRAIRLLLEAVGEDPNRDVLQDTWQRRVPDAFASLTEGYRDDEKPRMSTFESDGDEIVIKTGIPLHSLCEHHLLPYTGTVHVAYQPDGEVVGLSKLTRYIRWKARRLTIQEQLTNDIASGLAAEIGADAVAVEIAATHLCEAMRGVETESTTTTTATVGALTDHDRRRFQDAIATSGASHDF